MNFYARTHEFAIAIEMVPDVKAGGGRCAQESRGCKICKRCTSQLQGCETAKQGYRTWNEDRKDSGTSDSLAMEERREDCRRHFSHCEVMPLQLLFLVIIGAIVGSSSFIVVRNRAQESAAPVVLEGTPWIIDVFKASQYM